MVVDLHFIIALYGLANPRAIQSTLVLVGFKLTVFYGQYLLSN